MNVFHARSESAPSELRSETFTGTVWADPIMPFTDDVQINNVFFAPGGRTHWHAHERGQVLHVLAGSGWICRDGEAPQPIRSGDVVWIAPNERHWHGASAGSYMLHMATSLGKTRWEAAVDSEQGTGTRAGNDAGNQAGKSVSDYPAAARKVWSGC
jgi:quercetin dioxygenase-like cupin family protein